MDWQQLAASLAVAGSIGAFLGWLLPSPLKTQERLGKLELDLAVLVTTVNTLSNTVKDWIAQARTNGRK